MRIFLSVAATLCSLVLFGQNTLTLNTSNPSNKNIQSTKIDPPKVDLNDPALIPEDSLKVPGQDSLSRLALPIIEEGKLLYRTEMASLYGTDLFLERYKDMQSIGGFFSYPLKDKNVCIYFSKKSPAKVIGAITFDSTFDSEKAVVEMTEREFTAYESRLFEVTKAARTLIGTDAFFKSYANMSLNLSPLITNTARKVYVMTTTRENNTFVMGNDYVITFDQAGNVISKKVLHEDVTNFSVGKPEDPYTDVTHYHSDEAGDFLTPTDVCILLMYEKYAKWKTHMIVTKNNLNKWDCETDEVTVVSRAVLADFYSKKSIKKRAQDRLDILKKIEAQKKLEEKQKLEELKKLEQEKLEHQKMEQQVTMVSTGSAESTAAPTNR